MEQELESGYHALRETVEKYLNHSSYAIISLGEIFSDLLGTVKHTEVADIEKVRSSIQEFDNDEEEEEILD